MTRKLRIVLGIILAVKLLAVLAGSYPFDFATFVYQPRSFFEYGVNPMFYWNKGLPLLGIFYSQYALYQLLVSGLTHSLENTVLVHLAYKILMFAADVLTAFFLSKIIRIITDREDLARYGALVWLLNPFLLWSVELQGSYAIFAVLFSTISLWLFQTRRHTAATIFLGLSASVYYYAAVFVPFYALKLAYENRRRAVRQIMLVGATFCATIALLYLPYFFSAALAHELVQSLFYHAAPNASQFVSATPLPNYSLLKLPFYLVKHYFPTNLNAPQLFKIAGLITLVAGLAVGFMVLKTLRAYLRKKIYNLYRRRKIYDDERFIYDLLIAVTLFLLLVGNFQDHYLIWVFPFMVICGVAYRRHYLLRNMLVLSFLAILLILGANNLGIYFLDIVPFGTVNAYLAQSSVLLAVGGFAILLLLATNLFVSRLRRASINFIVGDYNWAILPVAFSVIIGLVSLMALGSSLIHHTHSKLGSDQIVYNFVYNSTGVSTGGVTSTANASLDIKDADFSAEPSGQKLAPNQYINPDRLKSPWFLYTWGGKADNIGSIVKVGQSNSLQLSPTTPVSAQLNFGKTRSWLRVYPDRNYQFEVLVKNNGLNAGDFGASVRFVDDTNKVIPGSDITLDSTGQSMAPGWITYAVDFVPPSAADFAEPTFTVDTLKDKSFVPGGSVQFAQPQLQDVNVYQTVVYHGLTATSNDADIKQFILSQPAVNYFDFMLTVPRDNYAESFVGASINGCSLNGAKFDAASFNFVTRLASGCFKKNNSNTLAFTTANYPYTPSAQISLVHKGNPKSQITYHRAAYVIFAISGSLLTATSLIAAGVTIKRLVE